MESHRGAFEYEWRARFHLPLTVVGRSMSWGEALRLFRILAADPASQVAAALNEWRHPMSREALLLADLFDVQHASKAKKRPSPYPRPWIAAERRQRGSARLSIDEFRSVVEAARAQGSTDDGGVVIDNHS